MQKYIPNFNQIFKVDKSNTPVTSRPESRQKLDENPVYGQELRQNFFMKAFEIYLEKVLSKNQQKLEKDKTKPSAQVRRFYEDDEENPNLPENLRNVQRLIKQRKKQNKLMGASKVEKFEKKMEIFKDLHSFVDIRSFLLESNVANYNNSEELLMTLKTHYKDGLDLVLSEEKAPKISRNNKNVYTYSPKHKNPFRTEAEQLNFDKDILEQRMKKYKDLIDLSKETVTQAVRRESENHITEGISKDLYTHLSEKLKFGQKCNNSNGNEEATRDNEFNESLEDLERRFIYAQKYLQVARKKDNKEFLSEDQKEKQKQEVDKLNTLIKKILLKGVVGEDGGPSTNEYYLNEYKTQYKKIKRVLHKVTKNIYKKDLDNVKEKSQLHTRMSSYNRISIQNESEVRLPSLRGPFLTEVDRNPYFLDEHKNNASFIRKNILEVEKSSRLSLINDQIKETTDSSVPRNPTRKKTIQLPKIITHLQEKRGSSFEPYFLKSDSERSIPNNSGFSSGRSYKKENRIIHKRFDQFLKAINRVETTQKFLTDDLKENMGEMAKEMNKLNMGAFAEPLSSIREVDPQGFISGKNLNGMKKAMKKFSNLNI